MLQPEIYIFNSINSSDL